MAEQIFAILDDGVVTNTIVADDEFAALISGEHSAVIDITDYKPRPGIAWTFNGDEWRPPMPTEGAWEWDETTHEWVEVIPAPSPEE